MNQIQKVIGLMSGTSLDGIDAALLETDGQDVVRPGIGLTLAYDRSARERLRAALDIAPRIGQDQPLPAEILRAEEYLTRAHAEAVSSLLNKAQLFAKDVALIGFHGQTILHRPAEGRTWQIGNGALLAQLTQIDVVNDFRSADVKAGGEGAPLMPLYHAALARQLKALSLPLVVVNIGGVANVTYISDDLVLAFDTGPGNGPLDDWMLRHTGKPIDPDGLFAAKGHVHREIIAQMLDHPYFTRSPPKSLDRLDFSTHSVDALSLEDGAATLAAFTAAAVARAQQHFPKRALTWIISGGGRHNQAMMEMLRRDLQAHVCTSEDVGWQGDHLEAQGFGYLAMRAKQGLPLSLPTTTGVACALTGGTYHPRAEFARQSVFEKPAPGCCGDGQI